MGSGWVHLRLCLSCGHVGCCDSSPNTHATKHYHQTHEPLQADEKGLPLYFDRLSMSGRPLVLSLSKDFSSAC